MFPLVHVLLLVVFQQVNPGRCRIQYYQLLRFDFPHDQFEVVGSVAKLFSYFLFELAVDTESVLFNSVTSFFFFLTSQLVQDVHSFQLDSRGLLRVSAGKSTARLWHSDWTWPATPQYLQVITSP